MPRKQESETSLRSKQPAKPAAKKSPKSAKSRKSAKTVKAAASRAAAKVVKKTPRLRVAVKAAAPRAAAKAVKKTPRSRAAAKAAKVVAARTTTVPEVLKWLERRGTKQNRDGMARYAIVAEKVYGVSVGTLRQYAKTLGRSHELALALWDTGWYEARLLASFVDEPERVTPAQMDKWCRAFDNWAVCDTVCFHLFDRSPYAFQKVAEWAPKAREFEKRAAFALLASLALHGRQADNAEYLRCLPAIEQAASDERNFVKKGVSWALRGVGRRNRELNQAALDVARRLVLSTEPAARWVGKDALRELTSAAVLRRLK